jgi:uncharacterized repeat protein (TIGR02543 family)
MKNVFKFLGIVSIACTFLAASCGGGDVTTYKIKVKANPSKGGVVTGDGTYESGANVILKATPNAGYVFVNWEDDANAAATRTITVTGDATYTANFEEEAAQSNLKVDFGSSTWNATVINAQYNSSAFMIVGAPSTEDYPFAKLLVGNAPAVGSYNGDADVTSEGVYEGSVYMQYFSSADRAMQLTSSSGNRATGDWWAKNLTVNVSAFDATTATISLIANATMGDLFAAAEGTAWSNVPTQQMTMTCTNIQMSAAKSLKVKGSFGTISKR